MGKSNKFLIAVLVLAFALAPAQAVFASGYNLAGVGAKALAMSGAYRAIADDWSATYWNPAGLIGQDDAAYLTLKNLNPIVSLTPNVDSEYPGYSGYRNGVEQTTKKTAYIAGAFGMTKRIDPRMTMGLSVFAPSALGADWRNLYTGPPHGYNNTVTYTEQAWFSDIKVIDTHPTFAYKVNDQVRMGLGISIQWAHITLQSPKQIPSGAPFPFEHFYVDATLEGNGMGFGFNCGLLWNPNRQMNLGFTYRSKSTLAIEGDVKQVLYRPYSPGMQVASGDSAMFSGGTVEASPEGSADFPIPQEIGFGVAYLPIDRLTFAFDVSWTNWGDVEEVEIEMEGNGPTGAPSENSILPMYYEDVFRFSFGLDYIAVRRPEVRIFMGYYFDPTPIPNGSLRPSITDVNDKHNYSLGFGYSPARNIVVEGYWEHTWTDTRTIATEDINDDGEIDNLAGDWEFQVDTFGLSIGYKF